MKYYSKVILVIVLVITPFLDVKAQKQDKKNSIKFLCQEWKIDSLKVNDINKKFLPPENVKGNFIVFNEDGSFNSQDMGINLTGKWRFNIDQMQIINSDFNHPDLKDDIVFDVLKLTQEKLVITSRPMAGGQVTLYYKAAKKNDTTTKPKKH